MSSRSVPWLASAVVCVSLVACREPELTRVGDGAPEAEAPEAGFFETVEPFFGQWCLRCHTGVDAEGGLALDRVDGARLRARPGLLREMHDRIVAREMPPPGEAQPADDALQPVVAWLSDALATAVREAPIDPGHVTIRRLSRYEYVRTVRDLVGVEVEHPQDLPADQLGHGFDTVGEARSLSPLHLEKYVEMAGRIAAEAIVDEDPENPPVQRFETREMPAEGNGAHRGNWWVLLAPGALFADATVPREGDYVIRVRAYGDQAGSEAARMGFLAAGRRVGETWVEARRDAPALYERRVRLPAGRSRVGVTFLNDYYRPDDPDPKNRDRNLAVEWLELVGPLDAREHPALQQGLQSRDPGGADAALRLRASLEPFVARAYRRPASSEEVERLAALAAGALEDGESFAGGLQLVVQAVLASPSFLFRVEEEPTAPGVQPVPDHELATRLSYFLWSTVPDDTLAERARAGELNDPDELRRQVRRMLRDPAAGALAENFATQWLEVRNLEDVAPDPELFPEFDDALRDSMRRETELFFEAVLREDRSVWELLDADFTFVDGRLARLYGLDVPPGGRFRRVRLPDATRGGLLTQASVLTVTSNPNRTSPVKRGKWVLEQILDAAPPPPPPEVGTFDERPEVVAAAPLKERFLAHRADPSCASCHERMDPLGFALEHYGPIGALRTDDGRFPVDASGTLPDGRALNGVADLREALRAGDGFLRCLVRKLMVYALGRGLEETDEAAVERILAGLPARDPTLTDLVSGIVTSSAFRLRRGAGGGTR